MSNPTSIPVRYDPSYEQAEEDEVRTITEMQKIFVEMAQVVAEKGGHAHRAVHAKGQGLLRGYLQVLEYLPEHYAQGLFSRPARYETVVRLSSPPAEQLPDSVSTPRSIAIKILGVAGEHVPESDEQHTQDFLMVNGPAFPRPGPQGFLKDVKLLAMTTEKLPRGKEILSSVLRATEAVIEAVGGESAKIKNMGGQPETHPLGETYFTQVPFMFGPYMAKFSLAPVSLSLIALEKERLDTHDDNAQRDAVNAYFGSGLAEPAEWELRVQLCTDIKKMPVEDASVEWDQALSPYVAVARLVISSQTAWDDDHSAAQEDEMAFDPWHALVAHRPLGALNRARKVVMRASRSFRSGFNKCPIHEPSFNQNPTAPELGQRL